ncbi:MAG: hypothetical protein IM628_12745 [Phenylobacterium sp.]|uniref:hypothetical protein n=1 Tax=Phenylobacterium sp. TaxID=1871053 RepID=UPI0025F5F335|nr:hypothetical protein [Phenylobacterium sp.]MCA6305666.1 hypothetical protein [Phenylobacterium sp.]
MTGSFENIPGTRFRGTRDPEGWKPQMLATTAQDRFYTQFFAFDTTLDFEVLHLTALGGTGPLSPGVAPSMAITGPLGGAAALSSPYIAVDMGTTVDTATVLLCRDQETGAPLIVRPPVELRAMVTLSQRLAENNVLIGFFECDPVTGVLRRGTTYAALPTFLNSRNMCAFRLDGATATQSNGIYRAAESGAFTIGATSFTGFTTVATGTAPDLSAPDEMVLSFERDAIRFRTIDVNSPTVVPTVVRRSDAVPNPTASYRVGLVFMNPSGPAPVSATIARVHMLNVLDSVRLDTSPRNADQDIQGAWPVQHVGQIGARIDSVSPTINTDSTTALGAGATLTGASRDAGATATFSYFAANVTADQAGTVRVEKSTDATTWRRATADLALAANGVVDVRIPVTVRYHRVIVVNGGVAQTLMMATSAYLRT